MCAQAHRTKSAYACTNMPAQTRACACKDTVMRRYAWLVKCLPDQCVKVFAASTGWFDMQPTVECRFSCLSCDVNCELLFDKLTIASTGDTDDRDLANPGPSIEHTQPMCKHANIKKVLWIDAM